MLRIAQGKLITAQHQSNGFMALRIETLAMALSATLDMRSKTSNRGVILQFQCMEKLPYKQY